jgi:hypothetical protein
MDDASANEAAAIAMANFRKRLRSRAWASGVLIALGAWLLYLGFADAQPVAQAFGVLFILYAGVIQMRMWSARRFMRDLRGEIDRKTERSD